jgi:hypothetical protein
MPGKAPCQIYCLSRIDRMNCFPRKQDTTESFSAAVPTEGASAPSSGRNNATLAARNIADPKRPETPPKPMNLSPPGRCNILC